MMLNNSELNKISNKKVDNSLEKVKRTFKAKKDELKKSKESNKDDSNNHVDDNDVEMISDDEVVKKHDLHVEQPDAKCIKLLNTYITRNIAVQKLTSKENFLKWWSWLSESGTAVQLNNCFNILLKAKIQGKVITAGDEQEITMKRIIDFSVDDTINSDTITAQEKLYDAVKSVCLVTRYEDIEKMNTNFNVSKENIRSAVINEWRLILLINDLNNFISEPVNNIRRFATYVASNNMSDELKNQLDEYASADKPDVSNAISMFYNWLDKNARYDTTASSNIEINAVDNRVAVIGNKRNANFGNQERGKRTKRIPKSCPFCGGKHSIIHCDKRQEVGCWKCGSHAHNYRS